MKKTETKYYCDFCHKECTDDHYDMRLPYIQREQYKTRDQLCKFVLDSEYHIQKNKCNLCRRCATIVSQVCEFLPKFCRGKEDIILEDEVDRPKNYDPFNLTEEEIEKMSKTKRRLILEYKK